MHVSSTKTVLVLFSRKYRKQVAYRRIFDILRVTAERQGRDFDFVCAALDELWIEVRDNRLIVTEPNSGKQLKDFDFVHFNWWGRARQHALAVATYLKRHSVPFLTDEIAGMMADTKVGEVAVMADSDVSLPNTFISGNEQILEAFRDSPPINFPLIVKDADAYGGHRNYLVDTYGKLVQIINNNAGIDFIVQQYIPNSCDYRCLIFGGEIKVILRRTRGAESEGHVNNTSAGGRGDVVPIESINSSTREMVVRAAATLGREQFSGADLIVDELTGAPYILEVNQTPEIEEGAEPVKKMTALFDYIEREVR